ncbi:MAG: universal stress protein [Acidimicrobiia bacterium]|nr:universal stress protein [Acidimicrobiia bacterium]
MVLTPPHEPDRVFDSRAGGHRLRAEVVDGHDRVREITRRRATFRTAEARRPTSATDHQRTTPAVPGTDHARTRSAGSFARQSTEAPMKPDITDILVPVDFSDHSEAAVTYAAQLAERLGASLNLLHVVEDPVATGAWGSDLQVPDLPRIREHIARASEERLKTFADTVGTGGAPFVTTVLVGRAHDAILDCAREIDADLIVMGTRGRSGLAHMLMGSVAERVVRHAACPVLTLHAPRRPVETGPVALEDKAILSPG